MYFVKIKIYFLLRKKIAYLFINICGVIKQVEIISTNLLNIEFPDYLSGRKRQE